MVKFQIFIIFLTHFIFLSQHKMKSEFLSQTSLNSQVQKCLLYSYYNDFKHHYNWAFYSDWHLINLKTRINIILIILLVYCRFCSQLGTLFGFVVNDLQDKIGRLNMLLEDDELHFSTVQNMILHETSNNLLKENSGCITMLRLHRGLGKLLKLDFF